MLPGPPCYTASAMNTTFAVLAAAAYLAFLAPLAGALGREVRDPGSGAQRLREVRGLDLWAVFGVLVLHALAFAFATRGDDAFRFGFAQALSAMLLLAVVFFAIESVRAPIGAIRLVLYPGAALAVLLPLLYPGAQTSVGGGPGFVAHLTLALVSYGMFSLAALHAIAMVLIDQSLHAHGLRAEANARGWISVLLDLAPPLLVMERLLFRALTIGFVLLTATLVTGVGFHEYLFGRPLRFDHKTVFSILSWLTFGVLLYGRWRYGWRGRLALRYVFGGFIALVLAYIGTHFVFEVFLGRR